MSKRRRSATDPASHHGFLDSLDPSQDTKKKDRRRDPEDDDSLDLDRIL